MNTVHEEHPLANQCRQEISEAFKPRQFVCIDLPRAVIVHAIPLEMRGWICVIGEPSEASYEWIARAQGNFAGTSPPSYRWSNQGYGSALAALRDALIEMLD